MLPPLPLTPHPQASTALPGASLEPGSLEPSSLDLPILGAGLLLLLVAALAAHAASGLLAYFPSRLERLLQDHPQRAALLTRLQIEDLDLRVCARLLVLAGSAGGLLLLYHAAADGTGAWWMLLGSVFLALFVVVTPAAAANLAPERLVLRTVPLLFPLCVLLRWPLLRPLQGLARPMLKLARLRPVAEHGETNGVSAADVRTALTEIAGSDGLPVEQEGWIANVVKLRTLHAEAAMTPRTEIHAMPADTSLEEAIRIVADLGHSRIPVYEDRLDQVVGFFYAKDVLKRLSEQADIGATKVAEVCREALFVPGSMSVPDLLREFRSKRVQMAIVLDEFGGTDGLITIEDVLEEIVGDITDEYDKEQEDEITVLEAQRIIEVSGRARVEEANLALGTPLVPTDSSYDTVSGFLLAHVGEVPRPGTSFSWDGLSYRVLEADERRIHRIRLTRLSPSPSET